MPLEGNYRVRVVRPAWHDVQRLFPRTTDKIEVRSHALKLRYWPEKNPSDDNGTLLDVDWSWIRRLRDLDIGELRIGNTIGGCDNIRIAFFRGDPKVKIPLPIIWLLQVLQKKGNDWTNANCATFKARRTLVIERFYKHREFE